MSKKLIISIICTIIYAFITLIAVLHHESWADEVQVWQLCRYLSISELIQHLQNEGHPSLFYLLIFPLTKISSNIMYMQLLCWISMVFAVFIMFFKSPFGNFTKFAIVTSAGFLYFLPVMARNYAIIPVLVFLAAILYLKQKEHPILYGTTIALIANTHAIMFGFAFILALLFFYDNIFIPWKNKEEKIKNSIIISTAIIITGLSTLILQLYNTTSSNQFITFDDESIYTKAAHVFSHFFFNTYNSNLLGFNLIDITFIYILAALFLGFFVILFINNKRMFLISTFAIGFQFAIYILVYWKLVYATRIFTSFVILIFCMWILILMTDNEKQKKIANILISIFFILTIYNSLHSYILDLKNNYSSAKSTAEYIVKHFEKNKSLFLIDIESCHIALAYYLDIKGYELISIMREKPLKYVVWDNQSGIALDEANWKKCGKYFSQLYPDLNIYVIRSRSNFYDYSLTENFEPVYISADCMDFYEKYIIYKYIK